MIKQFPDDKEKYPNADVASKYRVAVTLKEIRIALKKSRISSKSHRSVYTSENIVLETYPIHKVSLLRWLHYDCYPIWKSNINLRSSVNRKPIQYNSHTVMNSARYSLKTVIISI